MTEPDSTRPPEGRPATIGEVATLARVSRTTVSHALNGKGSVAPATRERVIAAARQLDYRPSRAARALRTRRTGTLAFVMPAFDEAPEPERRMLSVDVYMAQAIAAAHAAFARDHALLLVPPAASEPQFAAAGIDGGIVCDPWPDDATVALFERLGRPVVTIERVPGRPAFEWYVSADNEATTHRLLDHMAEAGAERIAFIGVEFPIAWAADCLAAYLAWTADRGREPLVVPADPHSPRRDAYAVTCALLDGPDPPDAILASDERHPAGVLRAAAERGVGVPERLMVATGIDSHEAREASPPVTAIDIKPGLQGAAAAEMLIARLEGEPCAGPRFTPAELHVRASTRRRGP
ncbi:MAG: LacI family DNA-binding transcriptional regulator [Solirubrobacteraceae bacterium]